MLWLKNSDLTSEVTYYFCHMLLYTDKCWYSMERNNPSVWIPGGGNHWQASLATTSLQGLCFTISNRRQTPYHGLPVLRDLSSAFLSHLTYHALPLSLWSCHHSFISLEHAKLDPVSDLLCLYLELSPPDLWMATSFFSGLASQGALPSPPKLMLRHLP